MIDTPLNPTIIDLSNHRLRFESGGDVHSAARRPTAGDQDWSLGMYHAETNADVHSDHWERHPRGDEAVCCIRGAVTLYLRPFEPDQLSEDVTRLGTGEAAIVPRGRWHRLEVDEPTDLIAVTFPEGTQFEKVEQPLADDEVASRPHCPDRAIVGSVSSTPEPRTQASAGVTSNSDCSAAGASVGAVPSRRGSKSATTAPTMRVAAEMTKARS